MNKTMFIHADDSDLTNRHAPIVLRKERKRRTTMQAAQWKAIMPRLLGPSLFTLALMAVSASATGQFGTPKEEEGARIFTAAEHPYYSGRFHLSGQNTT